MSKINNVPKGTTKRVRKDRTVEILEAATKLFATYGFRGTTLAMVSEAVGLTEPGVLHYFPSKEHLLQGVLEYRDQKDIERFSRLIAVEKTDVSELFELLETICAQNEKIPGLIRLFTVLVGESIRSDYPSHDFFVDRYRRGREIYTEQFFPLIKSEIHSEGDLEQLASLIMAVMDGLQIQWLLDPEKVDMVATFKLFSKIVVDYLENGS